MDITTVFVYAFVMGLVSVISGILHCFIVGDVTAFNTILILGGSLAIAIVVAMISAPWFGGPRS